MQTKVTKEHFDQYEKNIEQNINEILKQLGRKSSIKDVCALLDMKSSKYTSFIHNALIHIFTFLDTEEVNKALDEIHNEMDKVLVTKTELANHLQEQTSINEALCAENCSARWLWKSGELINGFAIPWEI